MQIIHVKTKSRPSTVYCGAGAAEKLSSVLSGKDVFVLTDSNVSALYRDFIAEKFAGATVCVIPAGERYKNKNTLFFALEAMMRARLNRKSCLVALGGGVTGDLGGLAASLYMRGIEAVQVPTTLLAQVDSSVGGKTAIDHGGVKNVIGTFWQPEYVVCDPLFLRTLPSREIKCGLGEILKTALLDRDIFDKIFQNKGRLRDFSFLEEITADCVRFKAGVVAADETEKSGVRKSLNMGHTTGHALELHYGRRSHGEYVLIGIWAESFIAEREGVCSAEYAARVRGLVSLAEKRIPHFDGVQEAAKAALLDKKNGRKDSVSMILPKAVGEYAELSLPAEKYAAYLEEIFGGNA
ncbi:MAG TPA: 3-dehydroquinate synthase [Candidatus Borkfalkia excrementavium]|uniref:3-dehydroquinate synthase n=1 Tax=Candidatus Borkfalkia excrementavium TaxID=2838505 RepID=A0A9D2CF58_9FIRM|nr:3-dehydroquinate synthase [Candidatus Borkfalkia excrementavium]